MTRREQMLVCKNVKLTIMPAAYRFLNLTQKTYIFHMQLDVQKKQ